jgi:hypothetical protein
MCPVDQSDDLLPGKGYNKVMCYRQKLLAHIGNAYG